jgi:lipopolysaccharide transport system ATP-binding protein
MTLTFEALSSSSDVVIRVEGLGKKYSLRHEKSERYTSLRDVVARQARSAGRILNPFTLAGHLRRTRLQPAEECAESGEEFWALKDVCFEIRRAERVGIIGRNGAGKSTLLKILSRITEPTTGRVEIHGRVASLLEVGTGFHPELTGRENIYLNGAILGMTRREIRSKFDEIVDFAEVEKFLDTPVKRYSSGMYVRLAFAVAAHLEPEILVVDEVLAVGDANFQRKCITKLQSISDTESRTIMYVSHQIQTAQQLCNTGIYLQNGLVQRQGNFEECVKSYLNAGISQGTSVDLKDAIGRKRYVTPVITKLVAKAKRSSCIRTGDDLILEVHFDRVFAESTSKCELAFTIETYTGQRVFSISTWWENSILKEGFDHSLFCGKVSCLIPSIPLIPASYYVNVGLCIRPNEFVDHIERAIILEIMPSLQSHSSDQLPLISQGPLLLNGVWY